MRRNGFCSAVALAAISLLVSCDSRMGGTTAETRRDGEALALVGATIYPSPTEAPILDGVVLLHSGTIVEVGPRSEVAIPSGSTRVDCDAMHLLAGFQNSHVHLTEPKWHGAADLPAAQLSSQFEQMFLRYGFTTVVDTGSSLAQTTALRQRIESDGVRGPRILTAGTPLYPENGIPFYLKDSLPPEVLALLHTPGTGEEAAAIVAEQIEGGADLVKLFVGSWVEPGRVLPMSSAVARAASREAHARGKLVFAHASNVVGLELALAAGVDVVAHALDDDRGWNESHVERMKAGNMALIPTLKLFGGQVYTQYIQREVRDYAEAGGQILFGTDVGYLTDYDPSEEYELMAGAGLDWRQILASLTTAPAERFGEGARRGRVAPGMDGDIVVLTADPTADVTAFTEVAYTFRRGRRVYENPV